jgi:hypothetical protein
LSTHNPHHQDWADQGLSRLQAHHQIQDRYRRVV